MSGGLIRKEQFIKSRFRRGPVGAEDLIELAPLISPISFINCTTPLLDVEKQARVVLLIQQWLTTRLFIIYNAILPLVIILKASVHFCVCCLIYIFTLRVDTFDFLFARTPWGDFMMNVDEKVRAQSFVDTYV